LHGGPKGFDDVEWQQISAPSASLFSPSEQKQLASFPAESAALFRLISPDGDQGFPGKLLVEVLFVLVPAKPSPSAGQNELPLGSLVIVYRAKLLPGPDGSKNVTPTNLTQHWGFNLDASLLSSGPQPMTDVKDHVLTINADRHIELDGLALSTGNLLPTSGDPEHAHNNKPIRQNFSPGKGYDSFYVFPESSIPKSPIHVPLSKLETLDVLAALCTPVDLNSSDGTKPLVELTSDKSGLRLLFESNQPGVQFYSGNFLNGSGSRKRIHGGTGVLEGSDGYTAGSAAFLEFHELLAAWMHPTSSSADKDTLLTTDEVYNNFVKVNVVGRVHPPSPEK